MEMLHRIGINVDDEKILKRLQQMSGFELLVTTKVGGKSWFVVAVITESNPYWEEVIRIAKAHKEFELYKTGSIFDTLFSEEEARKAEWLRLIPSFEQGYPQPNNEWPIKQSSYELLCNFCAIHRQIGSMRFMKEPYLWKNSFVIQIGVAELNCTPNVFEKLDEIKATGYRAWDCVNHKTGEPLQKVKQLYITEEAKPGLMRDADLKMFLCPECGRYKYNAHRKGIMKIKKASINPKLDFQRTAEWFGSGYVAFQEMIISNRIANLILDEGWKGVRFKVVELV